MARQINILNGWNRLDFSNGQLPSDRMLIKLLRPEIDPAIAVIKWCDLIQAQEIPDLGSQSLLQAWSNDIARKIQDEQKVCGHLIDKLCHEQGLDCGAARYHDAVMMYIGALFPARIQNPKKLAGAVMQLTSLYGQYQQGNVLAIGDNYAPLVSFDSATGEVGENSHKLKLRERFLDYRIADDYLNALYLTASENKGDEFLAYLEYNQDQRDTYVKSRSNTYRLQVENISQMVRQCQYCQKWYKQTNKNGKLWVKCTQDSCIQAWERARKHSQKPDGWLKDSKRKRCRICTKSRMVDTDRVCSECFAENLSENEL
jgi:hypothetical protein